MGECPTLVWTIRKGSPFTSLWSVVPTDSFHKAVATLWERPGTEIEAVHLAIALAYHGLLRVPSRAETSELGPRMSFHLSCIERLLSSFVDSDLVPSRSARLEPFHTNVALRPPVCENGRERSTPIRLLRLLICRSR